MRAVWKNFAVNVKKRDRGCRGSCFPVSKLEINKYLCIGRIGSVERKIMQEKVVGAVFMRGDGT